MRTPKFSFGPSARLRRSPDIRRCKERGSKAHSKNFLVLFVPSGGGESRMAVAVTTKIDKRSVVRNKVRRRLKEVFRLERHRFKTPQDILVIARNGCTECSFDEVRRQIVQALTNAKLFDSDRKGQ